MCVMIIERLVRIKRQHTTLHPSVHINPDAHMRNKIVSHIGSKDKQRITVEELMEFFNTLNEDEEVGKMPHPRWIERNKHILRSVKVGNQKFYGLTKNGKRIYKHLNGGEGGISFIPDMSANQGWADGTTNLSAGPDVGAPSTPGGNIG